MLWWTLFVVTVIFVYVKILKPHSYFKDKNVPYDKPVILFGSMLRVVFRQISFTEELEEICSRNKSYKYFGFYNFLKPILVVQDPELIKKVGIKEFDSFVNHDTFVDEELDPLFGKSIFNLKVSMSTDAHVEEVEAIHQDQKWRSMRLTLSPAFTSSKMKSMFVLISECADHFTDFFLKTAKPDEHITVELKDIFTRFANDVIATCAFGLQCNSLTQRENHFYMIGKELTDFRGIKGLVLFFAFTICPSLMKFFKIRVFSERITNFFKSLVMGTIKTREEKGIVRPDMINLLMEARKGKLKYEETAKKEEDTGFATVQESDIGKDNQLKHVELTEDDLTAQALIFLFAGFESISTFLCHMANELAVNPEIQQRLQAEIDAAMESCKGKITYEAIAKMKYMDMVVCETLRKWPPTQMTDRVCTKTFTIKIEDGSQEPLTLNKGELIWIPIYPMHRNSDYFPDPERFDPERFSDENKNNINPFAYIPFGIGPRNCLGSRFALLEAKTIFVYLLYKFGIVVDKKTQIPLRLSRSSFTMIAENGFWVGFKPRNK